MLPGAEIPAGPLLCYVTDRHSPFAPGSDLQETVRRAIAAGVDWIQMREKGVPGRELLELAQRAVEAARGHRTRILVNDRLDVALAADAAGVHLGGDSAPVADVVRWCRAGNAPQGFLVGASCHSLVEAEQAEGDAADYIFFGPVFETPSKAAYGEPQGVDRLAEVCRAVRVPVVAIGGITVERAGECMCAGAAGVAAIRLFQEADDVARVVRELRVR